MTHKHVIIKINLRFLFKSVTIVAIAQMVYFGICVYYRGFYKLPMSSMLRNIVYFVPWAWKEICPIFSPVFQTLWVNLHTKEVLLWHRSKEPIPAPLFSKVEQGKTPLQKSNRLSKPTIMCVVGRLYLEYYQQLQQWVFSWISSHRKIPMEWRCKVNHSAAVPLPQISFQIPFPKPYQTPL